MKKWFGVFGKGTQELKDKHLEIVIIKKFTKPGIPLKNILMRDKKL